MDVDVDAEHAVVSKPGQSSSSKVMSTLCKNKWEMRNAHYSIMKGTTQYLQCNNQLKSRFANLNL